MVDLKEMYNILFRYLGGGGGGGVGANEVHLVFLEILVISDSWGKKECLDFALLRGYVVFKHEKDLKISLVGL